MPERTSALAGDYHKGHYGSPERTGIIMELLPDLQLWQLSAWPATALEVENKAWQLIDAASSISPQDLPLNYVIPGRDGVLLRVEPLKWWVVGATPGQIDSAVGTTLDLSHSRVRLRVSGECADLLLNRFLPLDLRSSGTDRVMSTAVHHVGIALWQSPEKFELFIPRSFAVSIVELLCLGAEQFGYELR